MTAPQRHSPRQNHPLNALPASDYVSCYVHMGRSTKRDKRFGGCGPSRPVVMRRAPRISATPNIASCFFRACAWRLVR